MKQRKRTLALLTATITALPQLGLFTGTPAMALNAAAESIVVAPPEDVTADFAFTYDLLSNGTAEITGYTGMLPADLTIPSQIGGVAVTRIAAEAFAPSDPAAYYASQYEAIPGYDAETNARLYSYIETLTIEEGVTVIDAGAFLCCRNLTEVNLPESLKTICDGAFAGCPNLTQVEIPSGVQTILSYAFGYQCEYWELLVYPTDGSGCVTVYEPTYDVAVEDFTLIGDADSAAQTYAQKNDIAFVAREVHVATETTTTTTTTTTAQPIETTTTNAIFAESQYVIRPDSLPDKTQYTIGQPLDLSGLTVTLLFYDSHGVENTVLSGVSPLDYPEVFVIDTTAYNSSLIGIQHITISCTDAYQGFLATEPVQFSVIVESTEVQSTSESSETTTSISSVTTTTETTPATPVIQRFTYLDLGLAAGDTIHFTFADVREYRNEWVSFVLLDPETETELYSGSFDPRDEIVHSYSYEVTSPLDMVELRVTSLYGGVGIARFETSTGVVVTETTTAASTTVTSSATTSTLGAIIGDVNLDGTVTMADAILLSKYVANLVDFTADQCQNAHCYQAEGDISGNDAMSLLRFLIQMIDSLPEQPSEVPPTTITSATGTPEPVLTETTTDTACVTHATTEPDGTDTEPVESAAVFTTYTIAYAVDYPTVTLPEDTVLTSWDELYTLAAGDPMLDGYDGRFEDLIVAYDDTFFEEHNLLVHAITSTSVLPYDLDQIFLVDDTLHLTYTYDVYREINSPASVMLLMLVEIPKAQMPAHVQWHEVEAYAMNLGISYDETTEILAFREFVEGDNAKGLITSVSELEAYLTAGGLAERCDYLYEVYDDAYFADHSLILHAFFETTSVQYYEATLSWDGDGVTGSSHWHLPYGDASPIYQPCFLGAISVANANLSGLTLEWEASEVVVD